MTPILHSRSTFGYTPARKGFFATISAAHAIWRQRRALAAMDDATLSDIGVSRDRALTESRRPIWDLPKL